MRDSIAIIGAGVSGLTCGVVLQKEGFNTTIITKDVSPNTTSDISAALWYPYKAEPISRVLKWGATSIEKFLDLSNQKNSGVSITSALELLDEDDPDPWWKEIVLNFRMAEENEIPADYNAAYYFEAPLIEMPIYMEYLAKQYRQLGGVIQKLDKPLPSLDPVLNQHELVINCAGLGAQKLVGDSKLYPIRGQVVVIKNTDLDRCLIDLNAKRALTYIIPRQNDCVLGGSAEDHQWEETLSDAIREVILRHCRELIPELEDPEIITEKIGLRPAREDGIRLEIEHINDNGVVIHNYGHGGAGVTLSWGCAREVLSLVKKSRR